MTNTPRLVLQPFQEIGRDFLVANKQCLLADQMRLGKSVQSIRAAEKLRAKRILVGCPATVKLGWEREFHKWDRRGLNVHVVFGKKAVIPDADVVICNYDLMIYPEIFHQLNDRRWSVGIWDECHYLKGPESRRTKSVFLKGALASRCVFNWPMSGTPILNRPVEMYPVLFALAKNIIKPYTSYGTFTRHFCGGHWDGVEWAAKGATNKLELNARLNNGFMLRRTKKEVFSELPDPDLELFPIPQEGTHVKEIIAREFSWDKSDAKFADVGGNGEEVSTVRHELALYKVPTVVKHCKHLLTLTDKLVVWAWHRDVIDQLKEGLKFFRPMIIRGGVSAAKKNKIETEFRDDPTRKVIIANYLAGGVSLDFSIADIQIFVEFSWTPGDMEQAMARLESLAKLKKTLCQFCVVQGSLEERMMRVAIDKKQNIDECIDGNDPDYLMLT